MDEKISSLPYAEEWRTEMDNAWTDMFWQNRNLEQEHPEEIDDEQLFYFYNLLILYHIKTGELLRTITKLSEEEPCQFEEMLEFFGIETDADNQNITDKILGRLQKAGNFPLLWFERLKFCPFLMLSVLNLVSLESRLFPVPVLDQSLEFFLGHLHHSTVLLFGEIGANER